MKYAGQVRIVVHPENAPSRVVDLSYQAGTFIDVAAGLVALAVDCVQAEREAIGVVEFPFIQVEMGVRTWDF